MTVTSPTDESNPCSEAVVDPSPSAPDANAAQQSKNLCLSESVDDATNTATRNDQSENVEAGAIEVEEQCPVTKSKPRYIGWFERPWQMKNRFSIPPNEIHDEATAWSMDGSARGVLNLSGTFLGSAILPLALNAAGCTSANCSNTVYGLRPTSWLSASSVIVGLFTALTMPFVGAIVDYTSCRKLVGGGTAVILVVLSGVQIMISQDTWFVALILEMVGGYLLNIHTTAVLAYLPDIITSGEEELTAYTSRFNITNYATTLIYMAMVSGTATAIKKDNVVTAKLGQGLACLMCGILFGYSWKFLFRKRAPLNKLPARSNLVTMGFKQVRRTTQRIWGRYPALLWFMLALLLSPESGSGVFLTISVTFFVTVVGLNSAQIGICVIVLLATGVCGSKLSQYLCIRFNPLKSFQCSLVYFGICLALSGVFLSGPESFYYAYLFTALFGVAFGWMTPSQRTLYVTLTPRGQETEIMGIFQFCVQILGWVPPLIFTIMNQSGINMRVSYSCMGIYLFISAALLLPITDYYGAVKLAHNDSVAAARIKICLPRRGSADSTEE